MKERDRERERKTHQGLGLGLGLRASTDAGVDDVLDLSGIVFVALPLAVGLYFLEELLEREREGKRERERERKSERE